MCLVPYPPSYASDNARKLFHDLVIQRQVSNHTLRRYIHNLTPQQWVQALEATSGCLEAGYKVRPETYDALMSKLLDAQQNRGALLLYQRMVQDRVVPDTDTYNRLLQLCHDTRSHDGAETLFQDMQRRGMKPNLETLETMINIYSTLSPSNWRDAVVLFDKAKSDRRYHGGENIRMTCGMYCAIMRVYLEMEPFDWRVVYNAYYEMRHTKPRIPFDWETYELVAIAMKRGNCGVVRRFVTFFDAWVQITPIYSMKFIVGFCVFFAGMSVIRAALVLISKATSTVSRQGDMSPLKPVTDKLHDRVGVMPWDRGQGPIK